MVAAVLALIAGLVYLYLYWDEVKAGFADTSWGAPFVWVMDKMETSWKNFKALFTDFSLAKTFNFIVAQVLLPFEAFFTLLANLLDKIPGMGDIAGALKGFSAQKWADMTFAVQPPQLSQQGQPPAYAQPLGPSFVSPKALPAQQTAAFDVLKSIQPVGLPFASPKAMPMQQTAAFDVLKSIQPVHNTVQVEALQALKAPAVPSGGLMGAFNRNGGSNNKNITIHEQHNHVEHAPQDFNEHFLLSATF